MSWFDHDDSIHDVEKLSISVNSRGQVTASGFGGGLNPSDDYAIHPTMAKAFVKGLMAALPRPEDRLAMFALMAEHAVQVGYSDSPTRAAFDTTKKVEELANNLTKALQEIAGIKPQAIDIRTGKPLRNIRV